MSLYDEVFSELRSDGVDLGLNEIILMGMVAGGAIFLTREHFEAEVHNIEQAVHEVPACVLRDSAKHS